MSEGTPVITMTTTNARTYLTHLFSLRRLTNTTILFYDNNFTTLSLLGPLIKIDTNAESYNFVMPLVMVGNRFVNVHAYLLTNLLHVIKRVDYNSNYNLVHYHLFGGGIHIQSNYFNNIIGCQSVDSGLIFLGAERRPDV